MEVTDDIKTAKKNIKIVSVTEVLLQSPVLSMIIVDAEIDHTDLDLTDSIQTSSNSYTTIINLFTIQPKSLQEGHLIIASPEFKDQDNIEPTNIFPKPPVLDAIMTSADLATKNSEGSYENIEYNGE